METTDSLKRPYLVYLPIELIQLSSYLPNLSDVAREHSTNRVDCSSHPTDCIITCHTIAWPLQKS